MLIDTHVWLRWLAPRDQPLPALVIDLLEGAEDVAVSAVSCWELAWLHKRGRVVVPFPTIDLWLAEALGGSGISCLDLTGSIAARAAALPDIHRDPADRFIIATALETRRRLLTLDATVRRYSEVVGLLT